MAELIEIKALFSKTARGTREEMPGKPKQPGDLFVTKQIRIGHELIPEVKEWVEDGRIVKYEIARIWTMGEPRLNTFWFSDPNHAMLFKLTYG